MRNRHLVPIILAACGGGGVYSVHYTTIQLTNHTRAPICHVWQTVTWYDAGNHSQTQPVVDAKSPAACVAPGATVPVKVVKASWATTFSAAEGIAAAPSTTDGFPFETGTNTPLVFESEEAQVAAGEGMNQMPHTTEKSTSLVHVGGQKIQLRDVVAAYDKASKALAAISPTPRDRNQVFDGDIAALDALAAIKTAVPILDEIAKDGPYPLPIKTGDGKTFDIPGIRAALVAKRDQIGDARRAAYSHYIPDVTAAQMPELLDNGLPDKIERGGAAGKKSRKKSGAIASCWTWDSSYRTIVVCFAKDGKVASRDVREKKSAPAAASSGGDSSGNTGESPSSTSSTSSSDEAPAEHCEPNGTHVAASGYCCSGKVHEDPTAPSRGDPEWVCCGSKSGATTNECH